MFRQFDMWYRNLTPLKQLIISFVSNWIFWFISGLIRDKVFFEEERSLIYHIFGATWMALFMTSLFNYRKIKSIFKSNDSHTGTEGRN